MGHGAPPCCRLRCCFAGCEIFARNPARDRYQQMVLRRSTYCGIVFAHLERAIVAPATCPPRLGANPI